MAKLERPILLIDDSDDIRDVFRIWMEMEGYEVKTASTADKALEWIREGLYPCMILVDLNLPGMSGQEFVSTVRRQDLVPQSPIYIFSGSRKETIAGATGWVKKPVDISEIFAILSNLKVPCQPAASGAPV